MQRHQDHGISGGGAGGGGNGGEGTIGEGIVACASGTLAALPEPTFAEDTAMTVVMAAKGYPGTPEKGGAIVLDDTSIREDGDLVPLWPRPLHLVAQDKVPVTDPHLLWSAWQGLLRAHHGRLRHQAEERTEHGG